MKEDYREKNWRERRTIAQEFDYYISVFLNDNPDLKESKVPSVLKQTFFAGASSTLANIAEQIQVGEPAEFVGYIKSMEKQLSTFIKEMKHDRSE